MELARLMLGTGLSRPHLEDLRASRLRAFAYLLVLLCFCPPAYGQDLGRPEALAIENQVRQASRNKTFRPPSTDELRAAERLFTRTLRGDEPFAALRDAWAELRFELEILELQSQQLWLLSERPGHELGRGFYAFRPAATIPVAVQAPHSFADKNTRRLTAQLFLDSQFAAAAWNTVHRETVDVAHTDACLLNAFTRAFLRVRRVDAVVCQLHGFAKDKRTTYAGRTSDLIVSNGSRTGEFWLQRAVSSLRQMSPDIVVRLFPNEVSELGATTNRQARLIRETGLGTFLHLEMSAQLRETLVSRPAKRAELLKTLEHVFRSEM